MKSGTISQPVFKSSFKIVTILSSHKITIYFECKFLLVCNQNTDTIKGFPKGCKIFGNQTRFGGQVPICLDKVLGSFKHKIVVKDTSTNRIWEVPSNMQLNFKEH
jgi:hypothetical protein